MNTVYGCTVFMLPQSTQKPQRYSIGFHTNAIPSYSSRPQRFTATDGGGSKQ